MPSTRLTLSLSLFSLSYSFSLYSGVVLSKPAQRHRALQFYVNTQLGTRLVTDATQGDHTVEQLILREDELQQQQGGQHYSLELVVSSSLSLSPTSPTLLSPSMLSRL